MALAWLIRGAKKRFGKNSRTAINESVEWAEKLFDEKDNVNSKKHHKVKEKMLKEVQ